MAKSAKSSKKALASKLEKTPPGCEEGEHCRAQEDCRGGQRLALPWSHKT
jgi:hypothetical protein